MADQTNGNGESLDEDQNQDSPGLDAGSSASAPDPLLGEQPSGGALSNPAVGSKGDTQDRASKSRDNMKRLGDQYASDNKQLSDAYAQQKKTLQDATQRLLTMQIGPSDQENALRMASINGDGAGRYDPGAHNAAQADILKARRESDIQRNQLIAQYAADINKSQIGSSTANINRDIQMMRIGQSDLNNADVQSNKIINAPPKSMAPGTHWEVDANGIGHSVVDPVAQQALADTAAMKLKNAMALKQATLHLQQGQFTPEAIQMAADVYRQTGKMLPGLTRSGGIAAVANKAAADAAAAGDTAGSMIANQQLNTVTQGVLKDFSSGKTAGTINGINTAIKHAAVLEPLIDNLGNTQTPAWNQISNAFATATGQTAPNNFDTAKEFVAGEISKAVLPGGGGEAERQAIANAVKNSGSPDQLKQAVGLWKQLLAGKTDSVRKQWDEGTVGKFGNFDDRFLLPETKTALGIKPKPVAAAAPAARPGQQPQLTPQQQALLGKYGVQLPGAQ